MNVKRALFPAFTGALQEGLPGNWHNLAMEDFPRVQNEKRKAGPDQRVMAAMLTRAKQKTSSCQAKGGSIIGLSAYSALTIALMYSRFMRAMLSREISFGHSTAQAPVFVQFPNPS